MNGYPLKYRVVQAFAVLAAACVFSACANKPPRQAPLLAARAETAGETTTTPLDSRAVLISAEAFENLRTSASRAKSTDAALQVAASSAAMVSDPLASGVVAKLRSGAHRVKSDLFVVVGDAELNEGMVRGSDVSIVAMPLSGEVPWSGEAVRVELLSAEGFRGSCSVRGRGCRPVSAGATNVGSRGLARRTLLNLEVAAVTPNAAGRRPRLLVPAGDDASELAGYECRGPVEWDACAALLSVAETSAPEGAASMKLPSDAIVLSEQDFLVALQGGEHKPAEGLDASELRSVLTAANDDDALGITAQLDTGESFSGNLFFVARNATLSTDRRINVHDYYLAVVNLSGRASWFARGGLLQFGDRVPLPVDGHCGLLGVPTRLPDCPGGSCGFELPLDGRLPFTGEGEPAPGGRGGIRVDSRNPLTASDRWPGGARVTLRVPVAFEGTRGIGGFFAVACSRFPEPPERFANPGGCGNQEVEVCNGLDDDCDGDVDEGDVCANRSLQCTCTPVSCASMGASCGTIPNGCGQVLTCGAACP